MELVRQRAAHEGAGLTVSVEFPLSEGLRARSGLKGGEFSAIAYYIQIRFLIAPAIACYDKKDT